MDKNGKIGGKISIIDIAVILLIVLAAAGIGMRFMSSATTAATSNVTLRYVVKINAVRSFTVDALKKGTLITDKKSEMKLAEIKDIEVSESRMQSTTANGEIKWATLPDKYSCLVTIEAQGRESEDGYLLDDTTEVSVGRMVELYTKYVKTSGEIIKVEVVE